MPPDCGVPPNAANNCAVVGVVPCHTVKAPFVPAFDGACSVTVTVAFSSHLGDVDTIL